MASASDAFEIARAYLNDRLATKYSDAKLMPYLRIAHREMQLELELNTIPVIKTVTATLTIPANSTSMGVLQPSDLVEPILIKERQVGGTDDEFDDMVQTSFLPDVTPVSQLLYWAWISEIIQFVGATVDVQIQLQYKKGLVLPKLTTDPLGWIHSEVYLGTKVAALASSDSGLNEQALMNLDKLIRSSVKSSQMLPKRRLAYKYRGNRFRGAWRL